MPTQEQLVAYLRQGTQQGASHQQLVEQLLEHGWSMLDINSAFNALYKPSTPAPAASSVQPIIPPVLQPRPEPQPVAPTPAPVPVPAPAPTQTIATVQPIPPPVLQAPEPRPQPIVSVPLQPMQAAVATAVLPTQKKRLSLRLPLLIIGVLVGVVLIGGIAYAYLNEMGPFARIPYTEANLYSGLLERGSTMRSSTYSLTGEILVEPRDEGAEPFTLQVSNEGELREQYQNDAVRQEHVSEFLSYLFKTQGQYPSTIDALVAGAKSRAKSIGSFYRSSLSTTDLITKEPYGYRVTEDGQNFELTITYETEAAVVAIRGAYGFAEENTRINETTITFTKDSPRYFDGFSTDPPEPFLVTLGEMMRMLPGEVHAQLGVSAASEWQEEDADWKFNVDAEGDFGDLTYKVNADALKKDDIYYFRINNLPSLFVGSLASVKGRWIKVDPATASSTQAYQYNQFSSIASQFSSSEEQYKKARAEWTELLKKAVAFADEVKLAQFKNDPRGDSVDGHVLYRYDLETRKEAILPFYEKLVEEASRNPQTSYATVFNDSGTLDYLKSEEFSQVYDYLNENTTQTLWVDAKGYPARLEYSLRVIPPDTAVQLKDKQVRVTWTLTFSDINKPVDIEEPEDARSIEEIIEETSENLYESGGSGSAEVTQSNLRAVALHAEIFYDNNNNNYGTSAFALGSCKETPNTLFADTQISRGIKNAAGGDMSTATCISVKTTYAVSVPITNLPGYSWCVDSAGASKQISKPLTSTMCP